MKALKTRIVAFVAGLLLGPAVVWGGLETGTYISDLVATNPLGSDLASTLDDHLRLLKSTIKTTFPNINNAVTVTDEQLNSVATNVAANPTGTVGLTAVNGSAATYVRSDGAPALSQSIAPTWSAHHIFTNSFTGGNPGAVTLSANDSVLEIDQANASSNERRWHFRAASGQLLMQTKSDDRNTGNAFMQVDRTGTTVDRVAFPSDGSGGRGGFLGVGTITTAAGLANTLSQFRTTTASQSAIAVRHSDPSSSPIVVHNEGTVTDNLFILFGTEAGFTTRGSIDFNRAGTLTRYNTTSDERLKKNFKPAPSARDVIDCITIESFDWKETGAHVEHGVVAQRLNRCAPYAVSKGKVWQVDKSTLIPALIKYAQEQDARIAQLEKDKLEVSDRLAKIESWLGLVTFDTQKGTVSDAARRH